MILKIIDYIELLIVC